MSALLPLVLTSPPPPAPSLAGTFTCGPFTSRNVGANHRKRDVNVHRKQTLYRRQQWPNYEAAKNANPHTPLGPSLEDEKLKITFQTALNYDKKSWKNKIWTILTVLEITGCTGRGRRLSDLPLPPRENGTKQSRTGRKPVPQR